jgi:hypothetical protein
VHLDEIGGIAGTMKEDGRMIGKELDHQDGIIDKLHQGLATTTSKMKVMDNRLRRVIKNSSKC